MRKVEILRLLSDFISIQSVSADSKRRGEILKAVDFLTKQLRLMGFKVRLIEKDSSPPLILGVCHIDTDRYQYGNRKTIGIYGHYDVQPEDPVDEWKTPPFTLTVRDGKMYGRGVADNKGHVIQNLISIKHLIETKKLDNNIVFILEGEEETGSVHFEDYVSEVKDLLSKVDVFYVTDVGMHDKNIPQIIYSLRGLLYFELELEIGMRDLHSGIYGNRVLNPVQIFAHLFAKMKDEKTGKVLIPDFYANVKKISQEERKLLTKAYRSDEEEKKEAGVYRVLSLDKRRPYLSSKTYPSLDINGIISGYTGEGAKTVIPRKAVVKFSFRLVESQAPNKIERLIKTFITKNLPKGIKFQLRTLSRDAPFYTDFRNDYVQKTARILKKVFHNDPIFNRVGGSIPAAEVLQRFFKKPIILTGFTIPGENMHSPNENFDEEMFFKAIKALEKIYSQ